MSRRRAAALALAAFSVAALGAAGACFSDKELPTGSGDADFVDCRVAFDRIPAGHVIVAMQDFVFIPDSVRIAAGTTITWVNCDDPAGSAADVDHTSTANDGTWGSELFSPGETFSFKFDEAGVFPYHCIPHRALDMVGTVVVD